MRSSASSSGELARFRRQNVHRRTGSSLPAPAPSWMTRLRPWSLARYRPRSARRRTVSAVSPGWTWVTPKLAVARRPARRGCSVRLRASRICSARRVAAATAQSGQRMTNSSPPYRATRSQERAELRSTMAVLMRTASPAWWP